MQSPGQLGVSELRSWVTMKLTRSLCQGSIWGRSGVKTEAAAPRDMQQLWILAGVLKAFWTAILKDHIVFLARWSVASGHCLPQKHSALHLVDIPWRVYRWSEAACSVAVPSLPAALGAYPRHEQVSCFPTLYLSCIPVTVNFSLWSCTGTRSSIIKKNKKQSQLTQDKLGIWCSIQILQGGWCQVWSCCWRNWGIQRNKPKAWLRRQRLKTI